MIRFVKSLALFDMLQGLWVTLRYLFAPKFTQHYPEEKTPVSPRFRGMHALRTYPNGKDRCVACKLCEAACPSKAITIEIGETQNSERFPTRYEIDQNKCIFCGLCQEACPTEAIVQTSLFEYSAFKKEDLYFTKEELVAIGKKYEKEINENLGR